MGSTIERNRSARNYCRGIDAVGFFLRYILNREQHARSGFAFETTCLNHRTSHRSLPVSINTAILLFARVVPHLLIFEFFEKGEVEFSLGSGESFLVVSITAGSLSSVFNGLYVETKKKLCLFTLHSPLPTYLRPVSTHSFSKDIFASTKQ